MFLVRSGKDQIEFLLLQRHARPELSLPDFWQGITGALEEKESHEQAAIREVLEETGIEITQVQYAVFEQRFPVKPEWRALYGPEATEVCERVFYTRVLPGTVPHLSNEHKAWRWANSSEAHSLLTFGQNSLCLAAVEHHVQSNGT
ncbi:NUDIX domain-containing protein [Pseudaquabacterium terrae]|uniref:NUDIX domain-containing protein n=1 Tax=Pseudaquabacterium terrae TaxID=2732868 RepID=UPI00156426E1